MTAQESDVETNSTIRLDLPARPLSIAVGRSVIRRVVTFRNEDASSSFLVAFTEIVSNAIDEHERIDSDAAIAIEIVSGPFEHVTITDSGSGLDVADTSDPEAPEAGVERGRGLALARALVPEVRFESSPSGTTVTLPLAGFGIIR